MSAKKKVKVKRKETDMTTQVDVHYREFCRLMAIVAKNNTWNPPWMFGTFWLEQVAPLCRDFERLADSDDELAGTLEEGRKAMDDRKEAEVWLMSFIVTDE